MDADRKTSMAEEHDADCEGFREADHAKVVDLEPIPSNKDDLIRYYKDRIGK